MMSDNRLLPVGSTVLEVAAARTASDIERVPVPLRDLWNPATCPEKLLPWLAWAFSVDRWDESWPEKVKRQVIRDAFFIHQHKGTTGAVRRVVEPFGAFLGLTEWFESGGVPGTFRVTIGIGNKGITEDAYQELERLINDVKPCSRHLTGISLTQEVKGAVPVSLGCYVGDSLTVYAWMPDEIETGGDASVGSAVLLIDNVSFKL